MQLSMFLSATSVALPQLTAYLFYHNAYGLSTVFQHFFESFLTFFKNFFEAFLPSFSFKK